MNDDGAQKFMTAMMEFVFNICAVAWWRREAMLQRDEAQRARERQEQLHEAFRLVALAKDGGRRSSRNANGRGRGGGNQAEEERGDYVGRAGAQMRRRGGRVVVVEEEEEEEEEEGLAAPTGSCIAPRTAVRSSSSPTVTTRTSHGRPTAGPGTSSFLTQTTTRMTLTRGRLIFSRGRR